jgi:septal ring factor EnvC (AmiA/AmiB activator)
MPFKNNVILGTSLALTLLAPTAFCDSAIEKSLHWVDEKIHQSSLHLADIKKNRNDLQNNLKDIEEHISLLTQEQYQANQKLKLIDDQTRIIQKNIVKTKQALEDDQQELAALLMMEYHLGKESNLRLALNNESIQTKQRLTNYLTIINKKQSDLAQSIQNKMQDLVDQKKKLEASQAQYQQALLTIQQTKTMLEKSAKNRLEVMRTMNTNIASDAVQLESYIKQKQDLTAAIAKANQDIPVTEQLSFTYNFKENMHWPTQGRLTQTFGTNIDHSELTTDGVVISAPMGQPVNAVADGVVIFSKWLPGYGLLMIINQGHGYMSLYGRNQQLFFHNGQIIKKGDLIATVGNTGGFSEPGLYFAIRYNGTPVNPKNYI